VCAALRPVSEFAPMDDTDALATADVTSADDVCSVLVLTRYPEDFADTLKIETEEAARLLALTIIIICKMFTDMHVVCLLQSLFGVASEAGSLEARLTAATIGYMRICRHSTCRTHAPQTGAAVASQRRQLCGKTE
jgi:hypothetical protein